MDNSDNQILHVSLGPLKGSIRVPQAAPLRAFTLVIAGSGATAVSYTHLTLPTKA